MSVDIAVRKLKIQRGDVRAPTSNNLPRNSKLGARSRPCLLLRLHGERLHRERLPRFFLRHPSRARKVP